jgi:hypothetical protein
LPKGNSGCFDLDGLALLVEGRDRVLTFPYTFFSLYFFGAGIMPRFRAVWFLLPALAAALISCNNTAQYPSGGAADAKPAPEMDGKDVDGKPLQLADFRGKVVMLDFWATY